MREGRRARDADPGEERDQQPARATKGTARRRRSARRARTARRLRLFPDARPPVSRVLSYRRAREGSDRVVDLGEL